MLDSLLPRFLPSDAECRLVDVDPENVAAGAYPTGELDGHVSATASDVEASHAVPQREAIEKQCRRGPQRPREHTQALAPLDATSDHVLIVPGH